MSDHYKYVYTKQTKKEELYDLEFDRNEEFSIMEDYVYDPDRKILAPSRELYYYPHWDALPEIRQKLREEKNRIWREGNLPVVTKNYLKELIKPLYRRLKKKRYKMESDENEKSYHIRYI